MAKVTIKLNTAGISELLHSEEAMALCKEYADNALARLGDGYEVTTYNGKNRVNASVKAIWNQTKADNLKNNTILKAIRG